MPSVSNPFFVWAGAFGPVCYIYAPYLMFSLSHVLLISCPLLQWLHVPQLGLDAVCDAASTVLRGIFVTYGIYFNFVTYGV